MDFSIELYETPDGKAVVEDELDELEHQNPTLHALLLAGLNKLRHREYHRPPLCEPLGDGLFEVPRRAQGDCPRRRTMLASGLDCRSCTDSCEKTPTMPTQDLATKTPGTPKQDLRARTARRESGC